MDFAQRDAHNLRVLRRHDDSITSILDTSAHVVVYDFDEARQSWNKRGIEGTLFLVERTANAENQHHHRLLILNRLGLDNLELDLAAALEFQVTGDYLIYRDPVKDCVQGLWIYEQNDRARLAESLQEKCNIAAAAAVAAAAILAPQFPSIIQDSDSINNHQQVPQHPQGTANLLHLLLNNNNNNNNREQQQQMLELSQGIPPLRHLQVLWSVLDTCLLPHRMPRSLEFDEFVARLVRLVQEPSFQANLYEAYKTV
ncbi:mRNA-decapping enzyme 1B [Physocladia obscura]|uniref:mRNA-decapping enzyme 1B n=1 Tax=Physocladia obscura TaxID=109957 RepID=A0AAD5T6L4_9FUNG|nr:mRNA-decapping enzyme 1B [Physocladia obscura]